MQDANTGGQCRDHVEHLKQVGLKLWCSGAIFGTDRRDGISPGDYGDDGVVGVGFVAQIAGELSDGVLTLLDTDNRYGASALLRQLIEVEYLAWWLAEHPAERAQWIRASDAKRRVRFSPRALRNAANGRFRREQYHTHCAIGGHPHPLARLVLPEHTSRLSRSDLQGELGYHTRRVRYWIDSICEELEATPV